MNSQLNFDYHNNPFHHSFNELFFDKDLFFFKVYVLI